MRKNALFILLLASLCLLLTIDSHAARVATLSGSIYHDTNGDNFKNREERSGGSAILWLYRVLPNGAVQRVRQVYTDTRGGYKINNVKYGSYFLSLYFITGGGTPIRTANFSINSTAPKRYIPIVTSATLLSNPLYAAAYTATSTPDRLAKGPDGPTTPYTP